MIHRMLGNTDLDLSAIALGCWIFGVDWWGHYTQDDCNRLCRFALDRGITFFDNGDAYGNGRAEELFAEWMRQDRIPRARVRIGSKFGYDFYADPGTPGSHRERKQDYSPAFLHQALEESLRRLRTDYIDLYMAHNIKLPQFRDDLWPALEKLRQAGKIRQWGVSLGPAIGWRQEGFDALMRHGAKGVQTVYNLFEQSPGRELCEVARSQHAGLLARVHDNSSILKETIAADTVLSRDDHRKFRDQAWKIYGLRKVEVIRPIALRYGMSIHELACKWLLMQPGLASITGTLLNEREIAEACDAVHKPDLTADDLQILAEMYSADFHLGEEAHPCDIKSSLAPGGSERSQYVPPPVLVA